MILEENIGIFNFEGQKSGGCRLIKLVNLIIPITREINFFVIDRDFDTRNQNQSYE